MTSSQLLDVSSDNTTMSTTSSQDTEVNETDVTKLLQGHLDAIVNDAPVPEEGRSVDSNIQAPDTTLAVKDEHGKLEELQSQTENEATPEKKPVEVFPKTPEKCHTETSIADSTTESSRGMKRKYNDMFEFMNRPTVKDSEATTGGSVAKKQLTYQFPDSMKRDVAETDFATGIDDIDRSFDDVDDFGDMYLNEPKEDVDKMTEVQLDIDSEEKDTKEKYAKIDATSQIGVSQKLLRDENRVEMENVTVISSNSDSDETREQRNVGAHNLQEPTKEQNQGKFSSQETPSRSVSKQEGIRGTFDHGEEITYIGSEGKRVQNVCTTGSVQPAQALTPCGASLDLAEKNLLYSTLHFVSRKLSTDTVGNKGYDKSVKIKVKGAKGSVQKQSPQYREDDFTWKTKETTKVVGMSRQKKSTEKLVIPSIQKPIIPSILGWVGKPNSNLRHAYKVQRLQSSYSGNNVQTDQNDDGGAADNVFVEIVEKAIREENRNELIREEGQFFEFCESRAADKGVLQSKDAFFQSALSSELNADEDELPNLPDFGTVDEVLYGKPKSIIKRNRLKRKSTIPSSKECERLPKMMKTKEELVHEETPKGPEIDTMLQLNSKPQDKNEPDAKVSDKDDKEVAAKHTDEDENTPKTCNDSSQVHTVDPREDTVTSVCKEEQQSKEEHPLNIDSKKLVIHDIVEKKQRTKWNVLFSIPSFHDEDVKENEETSGDKEKASTVATECDDIVVGGNEREDPIITLQQIPGNEDGDTDELLDLITDVIDDPSRNRKKDGKKMCPREKDKTSSVPGDPSVIQTGVKTVETEATEHEEGNEKNTPTSVQSKGIEDVECTNVAIYSGKNEETREENIAIPDTVSNCEGATNEKAVTSIEVMDGIINKNKEMDRESGTAILDNTNMSGKDSERLGTPLNSAKSGAKYRASSKRCKLISQRSTKEMKRKAKNAKNSAINIFDNLKQKGEGTGKFIPLGQMIKAAASQGKKTVPKLDSSDSFHSGSSGDEMFKAGVQKTGKTDEEGNYDGKSVRVLRKRKPVANVTTMTTSEESSSGTSPLEEEFTKRSIKTGNSCAHGKQVCMSPKLVLYRVDLESASRSTTENQTSDTGEKQEYFETTEVEKGQSVTGKSPSELLVKMPRKHTSSEARLASTSDEFSPITDDNVDIDNIDKSTRKLPLKSPKIRRKQKSPELDVSTDATQIASSTGETQEYCEITEEERGKSKN